MQNGIIFTRQQVFRCGAEPDPFPPFVHGTFDEDVPLFLAGLNLKQKSLDLQFIKQPINDLAGLGKVINGYRHGQFQYVLQPALNICHKSDKCA